MFNMYTSIKAYTRESFIEFYQRLGGTKKYSNLSVTFDIINRPGVQITFYSNLTILFKGTIDNELNDLIDIIIDKELYVGSDEVGVGESIGPIVAAAIRFKSFEDKKKVILNGIKDSKKLTAKEIKEKADFIKEHVEYYTVKLEPLVFNEVYKKNQNVKAINAILQNELHKRFEGRGLSHVTDQFVNENKYNEYIANSDNEPFKGKLMLLTKAEEQYLEVSAAAIISKDIFNDWVIEEFKKDGITLKVDNRLRSWDIYQDLINGKFNIDITKYIKDWSKN